MKRIVGMALFACLVLPGQIQAEDAVKVSDLKTFEEKLSYSLGLDVGTYFKGMGEDLNYEILVQGLGDSFHGTPPLLTQEEMQAVQSEFSLKMQAKQEAQLKELQEQNKKAGDEYLAKNKENKGVIVTASGLQYEVVKEGTGAKPKVEDTVKVHYKGAKVDGTVFDDSYKRGEPAVFGVSQVIPGWTETLQLMKEGSIFKVVIPANLAYGDQGVPPMIGPNSVLLFDVELISIESEKEVKG
jgi:FKBP-type peptidyl-prolyl cis-trans isomerase